MEDAARMTNSPSAEEGDRSREMVKDWRSRGEGDLKGLKGPVENVVRARRILLHLLSTVTFLLLRLSRLQAS